MRLLRMNRLYFLLSLGCLQNRHVYNACRNSGSRWDINASVFLGLVDGSSDVNAVLPR
jgi:hypothetical protein